MEERELFVVVFGLGTMISIYLQLGYQVIRDDLQFAAIGFTILVLAWSADAFDDNGEQWPRLIEHICYALSALMFTVWARSLRRGESKWIG